MEELIAREWKKIDNSIFPSKEDDGIEHVDDSYEGFKTQITMALERVYEAGVRHGEELARTDRHYD